MTTIKEAALNYTPAQPNKTYNIADLPRVSTNLEIQDDDWTDKTGRVVKQQITIINGVHYRVPKSVIEQLQNILKFAPDLEYFKVTKSGTTKEDTKYKVEPAQ